MFTSASEAATALSDATAFLDQFREEYAEYAAEARACGQEVVPFLHWCDPDRAKRAAQERWREREENDTLDLY